MDITEDDIIEVLLLAYRLAHVLDLETESGVLHKTVRSVVPLPTIVKAWQDRSPGAPVLPAVAALHAELGRHQPVIAALPELFAIGQIGAAFRSVLAQAEALLNGNTATILSFAKPNRCA